MLIPYARSRRNKGRSGWSFLKKIKLFIDSTIAFSYSPIRAISFAGSLLGLLALAYTGAVLVSTFLGGDRPHGWSTLMMVILLTASFQMMALGVLGEYLWRTLDTVRNRPPFVVERIDDERTLPLDQSSN
jgi:dolichol-phosphate mannosyltransferase